MTSIAQPNTMWVYCIKLKVTHQTIPICQCARTTSNMAPHRIACVSYVEGLHLGLILATNMTTKRFSKHTCMPHPCTFNYVCFMFRMLHTYHIVCFDIRCIYTKPKLIIHRNPLDITCTTCHITSVQPTGTLTHVYIWTSKAIAELHAKQTLHPQTVEHHRWCLWHTAF